MYLNRNKKLFFCIRYIKTDTDEINAILTSQTGKDVQKRTKSRLFESRSDRIAEKKCPITVIELNRNRV